MSFLIAPTLATAAPAGSVPATTPTPASATVEGQSNIEVQTYLSDDTTLVSDVTFGKSTEGAVLGGTAPAQETAGKGADQTMIALGSGSGGTSSASGCRRVTVNNERETLLGFTAYWFHTWTHWCWNRSTQVISDVQHGWTLSDVDPNFYWKGIQNTEFLFYDYSTNDGHPKSAYKNYQQGRMDNCVLKYGCIGTAYPTNLLRSYYNGTWVWETQD